MGGAWQYLAAWANPHSRVPKPMRTLDKDESLAELSILS